MTPTPRSKGYDPFWVACAAILAVMIVAALYAYCTMPVNTCEVPREIQAPASTAGLRG